MISASKRYKTCLTIAGSDSSGGAGIQADLKTFSAIGCYGMSVITALTAQNTYQLREIHTPPAKFIGNQLRTTLDDIIPDAVKIGMLSDREIINEVALIIREYKLNNVVVDPVMISKSGACLLNSSAVYALTEEIFPLASIVTPNIPETESILDLKFQFNKENIKEAAKTILTLGPAAVLIKGGHSNSIDCEDYFLTICDTKEYKDAWLSYQRIQTKNTHGTGCTLSSAIAAYLALGESIQNAVYKARIFLQGALESGAKYELGTGQGPPNVFWSLWNSSC